MTSTARESRARVPALTVIALLEWAAIWRGGPATKTTWAVAISAPLSPSLALILFWPERFDRTVPAAWPRALVAWSGWMKISPCSREEKRIDRPETALLKLSFRVTVSRLVAMLSAATESVAVSRQAGG
ncbi:MAG: hypothetical protein BWY73_01559 [candidate division TA06 bacterium ADurb.Bin417]|uniref:Uncharacterized protein n=1 Tax=candidate division TA06 bacterium ADurb.Bin417 TaxID=1852828 RepID=A0A1V5M7E4_UNCT6|nr:MAG: hypothetical protein BWY73_01559 [candidate division TA06 bacterium ADurb.Bin417]